MMQTDGQIREQKLLSVIKKHWLWVAAAVLILSFFFIRDLFYLILILAVSGFVLVKVAKYIFVIGYGVTAVALKLIALIIAVGAVIAVISLL